MTAPNVNPRDTVLVESFEGPKTVTLPTPGGETNTVIVTVKKHNASLRVMGVGIDLMVTAGQQARFVVEIDWDELAKIEARYHAAGVRSDRTIAEFLTERPLKWVHRGTFGAPE